LEVASRLNPHLPGVHYELGLALESTGDLERARTELREAVRLDPSDKQAHLALASLLKRQGNTQEAQSESARVEQLNRQEIDRDQARGANRAGAELAAQKEWDAAIEQFRKALELQPDLGEARFNLAGALLEKGKLNEAAGELRHLTTQYPAWPQAHYQLARALELLGRVDDACKEYRLALGADPNLSSARLALEAAQTRNSSGNCSKETQEPTRTSSSEQR